MATMAERERAKKFKLFRNGDYQFLGKDFVLNKRRVRTWESFLQTVTQDLKTNEAVRSIRTPTRGHRIKDLDELQENQNYVAVGLGKFKKIPYQDLADGPRNAVTHHGSPRGLEPAKMENGSGDGTKKPTKSRFPQINTKPPNGSTRHLQVNKVNMDFLPPVRPNRNIQVSGRHRKVNTGVVCIFVYPNGNDLDPPRRITVSQKMMESWEPILREVNEKIHLVGAPRKLYTVEGKPVASPDMLQSNGQYVAVGTECGGFKRLPYGAPRPTFNISPKRQRKRLEPISRKKGRKSYASEPVHGTVSAAGSESDTTGGARSDSHVVVAHKPKAVHKGPAHDKRKQPPPHDVRKEPSHPMQKEPSHTVHKQPSHTVGKQSSTAKHQQPSHTVHKQPSHTVGKQSSHVVGKQPSHTVGKQSSTAMHQQPSHTVGKQSSHVVGKQSSNAMHQQPSHTVGKQSSHVVGQQSANAMHQQPSHTVHKQSSHSVGKQSSYVVGQESSKAVHQQPSHPVQIESSRKFDEEPSQTVVRTDSYTLATEPSHASEPEHPSSRIYSKTSTVAKSKQSHAKVPSKAGSRESHPSGHKSSHAPVVKKSQKKPLSQSHADMGRGPPSSHTKQPQSQSHHGGHQAPLSSEESVFYAKPVQHRRSQEGPEVDFEQDEGGVFRAKSPDHENHDAQEVAETNHTVTDLPIDQQEAEEVKDEELEVEQSPRPPQRSRTQTPVAPKSPTPEPPAKSPSPQPQSRKSSKAEVEEASKSRPTSKAESVKSVKSVASKASSRRSSTKKEEEEEAVEEPAAAEEEEAPKEDRIPTPENEDEDEARKRQEEDEAAMRIQAGFKGYKTRQSIRDAKEAATTIQANFKGHQVRQQIHEQEEAATKIKAGYKGYKVRKLSIQQNEAAAKIQAGFKFYRARKNSDQQNAAASKIQAGYKGYQVRKMSQQIMELDSETDEPVYVQEAIIQELDERPTSMPSVTSQTHMEEHGTDAATEDLERAGSLPSMTSDPKPPSPAPERKMSVNQGSDPVTEDIDRVNSIPSVARDAAGAQRENGDDTESKISEVHESSWPGSEAAGRPGGSVNILDLRAFQEPEMALTEHGEEEPNDHEENKPNDEESRPHGEGESQVMHQ